MRHILSIVLFFASFILIHATDDGALSRILRYSQLHQLFDCPLGMNEINRMKALDDWDFEWFADCVEQRAEKYLNRHYVGCMRDGESKTLTIYLPSEATRNFPFSAVELKMRLDCDSNGNNRSLTISYRIPVSKGNSKELREYCRDMLSDLEQVYSKGNTSYAGPYSHVYTVSNEDDAALLFSCRMPVPADKWYNVPANYVPTVSYEDIPDKAPCNKGKEPFKEFIKKFNSDSDFRIARRGFSESASHADRANGYILNLQFRFNEFVLKAIEECGFLPIRGYYDEDKYTSTDDNHTAEIHERCGQWFYPTDNSVIYSGWNVDTGNPINDCSIMILFERIDEEWCTTATWCNGRKLNDAIVRRVPK